ncbi:MAG: lipocalin-like domain-containing protein [Anaerolineae bacterium]
MARLTRIIVAVLIVGLLGTAVWLGWRAIAGRDVPPVRSQIVAPAGDATGFSRARPGRTFSFPSDHGPHPDFQTEWWYYTGNLATEGGRRFGYQLTFFRRALKPPTEREERSSAWAAEQVYMAHFAVTDVEGKRHEPFERFSRGAAGLAGAESPPYTVWLEDWRVEQVRDDPQAVRMLAAQDEVAIELHLVDRKGPILQGDGGYSQKGPDPGNASYYYSQTRLETKGTVRLGDELHYVRGWSWMDHEFSTSALAPEQAGWDWFALQLDDGYDLMVFQIRRSDGTVDPFASGSLIGPEGEKQSLSLEDFEIGIRSTWQSPHTGAAYPSRWRVTVLDAALDIEIEPYLPDQELDVSYAYWEGAVEFQGQRAGQAVSGEGYVELTGYSDSMQEQF